MFALDYEQLGRFYHPKLSLVLKDIEEEFGQQVITSQYRINDAGVHGTIPLRANDLRCRNMILGDHIAQWVNRLWTYDPDRPSYKVAMCHDTGGGLHLHIQVHDNTVRNR